jgi:hypothetical protein
MKKLKRRFEFKSPLCRLKRNKIVARLAAVLVMPETWYKLMRWAPWGMPWQWGCLVVVFEPRTKDVGQGV